VSDQEDLRDAVEERRLDARDESIPDDGERLPPDLEGQLLARAGFTRKDLYERRGPLIRQGLARLLQAGDEILEVQEDHAVIRKADGSLQSFWNIAKRPAWVTPVTPETAD
jgi:hypothetical protein